MASTMSATKVNTPYEDHKISDFDRVVKIHTTDENGEFFQIQLLFKYNEIEVIIKLDLGQFREILAVFEKIEELYSAAIKDHRQVEERFQIGNGIFVEFIFECRSVRIGYTQPQVIKAEARQIVYYTFREFRRLSLTLQIIEAQSTFAVIRNNIDRLEHDNHSSCG